MKPMLAATGTIAGLARLKYPLLASPKLDGIRALVRGGVVYSRTGKPIPSRLAQLAYSHLEGVDGELIAGTFAETQSVCMSTNNLVLPDFACFDLFNFEAPFRERLARLEQLALPETAFVVPHYLVNSAEEVLEMHERNVARGLEGTMLRCGNAGYKQGRSTLAEQGLIKLKDWLDSEFLCVGAEPLVSDSKQPQLGALVLQADNGSKFRVGTGFTEIERVKLLASPPIGKLVSVKYFEMHDAPRFPVFLRVREAE